jgi:hypothetical protein
MDTLVPESIWSTPSFSISKARRDMARSSKLDFDHLFLLYHIFCGYKHIIIRKYIWWQIQPYQIYTKNKKLICKLLVKDRKVWILICVRAL